jgi:hypothetical protein
MGSFFPSNVRRIICESGGGGDGACNRVMVCRKSILMEAGDRGWGVWEGDLVDGHMYG